MNRRQFLQRLMSISVASQIAKVYGFVEDYDLPLYENEADLLICDGEWHHVAITRQSGIHSLHVDGVLWGKSDTMPLRDTIGRIPLPIMEAIDGCEGDLTFETQVAISDNAAGDILLPEEIVITDGVAVEAP